MKKMAYVLMGLLVVTAFINCGENGVGSDDTAYIVIMNAPDGTGSEIVLTDLVPGAVETLYAVAFNQVDDTFLENVEVPAASWSISTEIGSLTVENVLIGADRVILKVNELAPPSNLVSVTKDLKIALSWTASASNNVSYNVYRATDNQLNTVHATASTNAYEDDVVNGTKYFYAVATMVSGDLNFTPASGTFSAKTMELNIVTAITNIVDDAARPMREPQDAIWEYDSVGSSSFAWTFDGEGAILSTNDANKATVDIYLEETGGVLSMKSPDLKYLSGATVTEFADMGAYAFDAPEVTDASNVNTWVKTLTLTAGHVYAIKLAEGYYIKMLVDEMGPDPDINNEYYAFITYGFQTLQGYTNFKTAAK